MARTPRPTPKQGDALVESLDHPTHRLPHGVKTVTIDSMERKGWIREVENHNGGFNWCELTRAGIDAARAERERRLTAQMEAEAAALAAEAAERKTQEQYERALLHFRETCAAAFHAVMAYEENADDTEAETGHRFTPAEIWGQVGDALGNYGPDAVADFTEERTPLEALRAAWEHLGRLAAAGALDSDREEQHTADARAALATATRDDDAEETPAPRGFRHPVHEDPTPAALESAAAEYEADGALRDVWNHSYIGGSGSLARYADTAGDAANQAAGRAIPTPAPAAA